MRLLLTCAHGGNRVPRRHSHLFRGHKRLLASHRAYDPGALALARRLASELRCPLIASTTTRLLVDLNRAPTNRSVFSEITRGIDRREQSRILATYHSRYRRRVAATVEDIVSAGNRVLHVAVHSFTPRLAGVERNADVGLLYDPDRAGERTFCQLWQDVLAETAPALRVRRNYPYRGTSDGLPTWLRKTYPNGTYWGIELEVSQRLLAQPVDTEHVFTALSASLRETLGLLRSSRSHFSRKIA